MDLMGYRQIDNTEPLRAVCEDDMVPPSVYQNSGPSTIAII